MPTRFNPETGKIENYEISEPVKVYEPVPGPRGEAGRDGKSIVGPRGVRGEAGRPGISGVDGKNGLNGTRGSKWFKGKGAPLKITDALNGDKYLDIDTGDVYEFS